MKGYKTGVDHNIALIQINQVISYFKTSLTIESPISRIIYIYIYEVNSHGLTSILKHHQTVEAAQLGLPRNNHRSQLVNPANRALH